MSITAEGPVPGPLPGREGQRPRGAGIITYLSLGGLSFAVLQSLVAPALGTIGKDLGVATSDASWVLTAYLLSASVLTPILGRLGDMVRQAQGPDRCPRPTLGRRSHRSPRSEPDRTDRRARSSRRSRCRDAALHRDRPR